MQLKPGNAWRSTFGVLEWSGSPLQLRVAERSFVVCRKCEPSSLLASEAEVCRALRLFFTKGTVVARTAPKGTVVARAYKGRCVSGVGSLPVLIPCMCQSYLKFR